MDKSRHTVYNITLGIKKKCYSKRAIAYSLLLLLKYKSFIAHNKKSETQRDK